MKLVSLEFYFSIDKNLFFIPIHRAMGSIYLLTLDFNPGHNRTNHIEFHRNDTYGFVGGAPCLDGTRLSLSILILLYDPGLNFWAIK